MLLLLPIGFHLLIFLHLNGSPAAGSAAAGDWRRGFILATVLSGVIVAVSAELLSLLGALNQPGVALVWSAAALIALWTAWRKGTAREGLRRLRAGLRDLDRVELAIIATLVVLALLLLLVAWVSPPNNVDSLIYHMSKVVHWAQNESLRHYAAINHAQLIRPPWAEMAILHLRTLFGSDRPANLVQWFSMVVSVVAVSGIAGLLGGSVKAQLLAAAAAFSIPMGVLQSTSTQNDYAAALWAIALAYLVLLGMIRKSPSIEVAALACSVGLGMLTKGTFFAYAAPLLVWQFLPKLRRSQFKSLLLHGTAIAAAAVVLNLGFWSRNVVTYGGPYGPSEAVRLSLGRVQSLIPGFVLPTLSAPQEEPTLGAPEDTAPSTGGGEKKRIPFSAGPDASDFAAESEERGLLNGTAIEPVIEYGRLILGMAGWNLITPSSAVNNWIMSVLGTAPSIYGESYLAILRGQAWNHEDTAGNPLHLLLFGFSLLILAATRFKGVGRLGAAYTLSVIAAYVFLPTVASAGAGNWGIRYQLPFFVLACPVIAWGLSALRWRSLPDAAAGLLLISALPYMVFNNTRPIVGKTPWPTRVHSVFVAPPPEILLAMAPEAREAFVGMAEGIAAIECDRVGLWIDSGDLEYAFWWLLDAPQSGVRIETLYPLSSLSGFVDRDFAPCAIICSVCGESRVALNGLNLQIDASILKLYVGPNFRWEQAE